jgi:hypothetical protein
MSQIVRLTLFKIPNKQDVEAAVEKYSTLSEDAQKVNNSPCSMRLNVHIDPNTTKAHAVHAGRDISSHYPTQTDSHSLSLVRRLLVVCYLQPMWSAAELDSDVAPRLVMNRPTSTSVRENVELKSRTHISTCSPTSYHNKLTTPQGQQTLHHRRLRERDARRRTKPGLHARSQHRLRVESGHGLLRQRVRRPQRDQGAIEVQGGWAAFGRVYVAVGVVYHIIADGEGL